MPNFTYPVAGLRAPVDILVDTWGVPHIFAAGTDDLYLAQGFNVARERLFQMDLWRRRGLGLLSEVLGSQYLEQDRARRLFLYRGNLDEEWNSYGPAAKQAVTAFTVGINSYVGLCEQGNVAVPEEFTLLDYAPSLWRPEDIVRVRGHGLYHNVEQEVARWRTLARYGRAVEDLRCVHEPRSALKIPQELRGREVPADLLRDYQMATGPVTPPAEKPGPSDGQGSNNWVVAGHRTTSGRPILANDPHRSLNLPSLRYLAHLHAPGINVIGGGEPMLPGVSIGHNGVAAFGLTVFPADQEDLYVYEMDHGAYQYRDEWESVEEVVEEIPVRDGAAVPVKLRFTRHGPVIYEDVDQRVMFAVRAAWLEPGMAPYLGSLRYMNAKSWDEFLEALRPFGGPAENYVYADTNGDIGWVPAGRLPTRPNWDGCLPVPGDGAFEWGESTSLSELTKERNPARGWLASANEFNLHHLSDFEAAHVTRDWYAPSRYERIASALEKNYNHSVDDSLRLQTDYLSEAAMEVLARTLESVSPRHRESEALKILSKWDGVLSPDSTGAALYEVWYRRHFRPALLRPVLERLVPASALEGALGAVLPSEHVSADSRVLLRILRDLPNYLGCEGRKSLSELVVSSVDSAVQELASRLGRDPSAWRWGDLHRAEFVASLRPVYAHPPAWTSVGPIARGGSGDTVGQAAYTSDFRQSSGATFRVVIDVGSWDDSLAMNAPGQSGRPTSPHHHDLAEGWGRDGAFPLLYSRERIEAAVSESFSLVPA